MTNLLTNQLIIQLDSESLKLLEEKAIKVDLKPEEYIKKLILNDVLIFSFSNGITYHTKKKILFKDRNTPISLTGLEAKLFEYLFNNRKRLCDIEEIRKNVWKKNATIFTIRNVIKKLRDKTTRSFIENKSNGGYKLCEELL